MKADIENYDPRLPLSSDLTQGLTLSPRAGRADERNAITSLFTARTGRKTPVRPPQLRSYCGGRAGRMRGPSAVRIG